MKRDIQELVAELVELRIDIFEKKTEVATLGHEVKLGRCDYGIVNELRQLCRSIDIMMVQYGKLNHEIETRLMSYKVDG